VERDQRVTDVHDILAFQRISYAQLYRQDALHEIATLVVLAFHANELARCVQKICFP
jgi:hypothetical protein